MSTWTLEADALVRRDRKCKLVVIPRARVLGSLRRDRKRKRRAKAKIPSGPADWRVVCDGDLEERGTAASVTAAKTRAAKVGKNLNQLYALIRVSR